MPSEIKVVRTLFNRRALVMPRRPFCSIVKAQNRFDALVVAQLTKVVIGLKAVGEWMPADGQRFAALQQNPQRMAFFVGVFDQNVRLTELVDALRAMGEPCS